jgi:hypothetical protein
MTKHEGHSSFVISRDLMKSCDTTEMFNEAA